jgi:hypothetical protein
MLKKYKEGRKTMEEIRDCSRSGVPPRGTLGVDNIFSEKKYE